MSNVFCSLIQPVQNLPNIKAETFHVDELVSRALRGRIRVPRFQRGLKWRDTDVQKLFDSINQGFPIGTLLMWKRPADDDVVSFGPIEIQGPKTDDAWWVVDGQQRLTSLVAGLKHPNHHDPDDPFVVYYDMRATKEQHSFFRPHRLRKPDPYCIPIARCFDAADFQQWLFDFVAATKGRDYIEHASGVATRIRNYRVPVYVVETDDAEVAQQIFLRTNRAGRRMDAHEVFVALSPISMQRDHRPEAIAQRLSVAFGMIDPNVVTKVARSLVSEDVTRADSLPEVSEHPKWMIDTEAALQSALQFVRECGVPHTRLLPAGPTPLITIARFFSKHPNPSDRNKRLLRRWLWRGFFSESLGSDAKTLRRSVVAVTEDESESVQALLGQIPKDLEGGIPKEAPFVLPSAFDARDGRARLVGLILALQNPAAPETQQTFLFPHEDSDQYDGDVFDWLQKYGADVFCAIPSADNHPAARFISPGVTSPRMKAQLLDWAKMSPNHPALASHLVTPDAAQALLRDDLVAFVAIRGESIKSAGNSIYKARAEPRHSDRPQLGVKHD